jgi:hypothetical protein
MQDRYHHGTVAHVFCQRAPIRIYSERVGFRHVIGGLVQCYRIDYRRLERNVLTFALDGQVVSLSQQAYEPVVQKRRPAAERDVPFRIPVVAGAF